MLKNRKVEGVKSFSGQKSGLPVEAYGFNAANQAKNFFLKEGRLERPPGGTLFTTALTSESGGVTSLHQLKYLLGVQRGESFALQQEEGGTVLDTIFSALTGVTKFFSSQWRDRLYLVDGTYAKFILNRTSTEISEYIHTGNLGLDPPNTLVSGLAFSGAVTATEYSAGTGNIANGSYYYFISFFDGETNSESPLSGGASAAMSTDGIFELSPNAGEANGTNFGPAPKLMIVGTGPSGVSFDFSEFSTYLQACVAANPRYTHFRLYRATLITTGPPELYSSLFAVPAVQDGDQKTLNIDAFIAAGLDFHDNTATASLPAISPPENNSPPPTIARLEIARQYMVALGATVAPFVAAENSGLTYLRTFRDQIFGIGARSTGWNRTSEDFPTYNENGRNAFSGLLFGSEVYQPDYWPFLWEVNRGDGQAEVALAVLGDTALLIFKEKSTYYLSGSSPEDYIVRVMDTEKGCVSAGSVQELPIGVITLDSSGFVLFNKLAQGEKISSDIQDVVDSIQLQYSDTFYSWYDNRNHLYYCAVVAGSGATTPNITLCLSLDDMQWTYTQGQEGLSRVCDLNSEGGFVDFVGMANNGRIVDCSNPAVTTFQGDGQESIWTSGTLSYGDDQHKKKMRWVYPKIQAVGNWSITLEVIPDFREDRKFSINVNYDAEEETWYSSTAATDGSLIWDEGTWAHDGPEKTQLKIPVICKGRLFQVRIINRDLLADRYNFSIEGISAEAVMLLK